MADNRAKIVVWHRALPPLGANSSRVPGTLVHRDELWFQCYRALMANVENRLVRKVTRLGGHFTHVHDEAIDPKHDDAAGEPWLRGRFSDMLYRPPPESR